MKELIFSATFAAVAFVAAAKPFSSTKAYQDMTDEEKAVRIAEARANRARVWGDRIDKPNTQKGKIALVDAGANVSDEDYAKVVSSISVQGKYKVVTAKASGDPVTPENATSMMEEQGAQFAVFVVNCDKCRNLILAAPDSGWAIVNAAVAKAGAKNATFERARIRKAITRAYLVAAGAAYSRYPGSLMSPITKPSDLDKLSEDPPVDVLGRCKDSLEVRGVTPQATAFYRKAVEEGWAPAPTNEAQKVIWDKVHAIPQKPIKIEFDPKTDTK